MKTIKVLKKILFLILIITGVSFKVKSQEKINFSFIDTTTYKQYLQKDWKNLIKTAKKGLENNIDYYYLRMRIGIAYYEQKQFIKAIPHFTKALEFNNDTVAVEYLYYSYMFSGKYFEARIFANKQDKKIKNKLLKNDKPNSLFFDYQYAKNTDSKPVLFIKDVYDGEIRSDEKYFDLGFNRLKSERVFLSFSFSRYSSLLTHYHQDPMNGTLNEEYDIRETSLYSGVMVHINKNFNLSSYTNLIFGKKSLAYNLRRYPQPMPQRDISRYLIPLNINNLDFSFYNFKAELGLGVSKIDSSLNYLTNLGVTYFPLNNNKLGLYAKIEYLNTPKFNDNFTNPNYTAGILTIFFNKLIFDANYKIINSENYIEQNGFVVYSGDKITDKYTFELTLSLKNINLFARYQYFDLTRQYMYNFKILNNNFNNQTFLGGLKWKL